MQCSAVQSDTLMSDSESKVDIIDMTSEDSPFREKFIHPHLQNLPSFNLTGNDINCASSSKQQGQFFFVAERSQDNNNSPKISKEQEERMKQNHLKAKEIKRKNEEKAKEVIYIDRQQYNEHKQHIDMIKSGAAAKEREKRRAGEAYKKADILQSLQGKGKEAAWLKAPVASSSFSSATNYPTATFHSRVACSIGYYLFSFSSHAFSSTFNSIL